MKAFTKGRACTMENRKQNRFRTPYTAKCEGLAHHNRFYSVVHDLSHGGMKLVAESAVELDEDVNVDINFIDKKVSGKGKVKWCSKSDTSNGDRYSIGVEFTDMDETSKAMLENFINMLNTA